MNTTELKKFAQTARRQLIEQVGAKLDLVLQDDSAVLRDQEKALQQLQDEITNSSRDAVIDLRYFLGNMKLDEAIGQAYEKDDQLGYEV